MGNFIFTIHINGYAPHIAFNTSAAQDVSVKFYHYLAASNLMKTVYILGHKREMGV